jgi:glyoxylase-like metal-dependent hydrolase (beta-lactamase superfamily II)
LETKAFFDPTTFTLSYVVFDPATKDAVVIDPVLDLDLETWRVSTASIVSMLEFIEERELTVHWILDTHAHADHLSGMETLKDALRASTAIGKQITVVQSLFAGIFNFEDIATDGSQWDQLLQDGQTLDAGSFQVEAIHTPGHTPACMSYRIGDAVYTGDALFMPDAGTGRCDFPKGSAELLYHSITEKLYRLPDSTKVFVGHDYQPDGRELAYESSIGEEKERNVQLRASTGREAFIEWRMARDVTLGPPRFILPALQINIDAGRLPKREENGRRYLKIPLDFLGG